MNIDIPAAFAAMEINGNVGHLALLGCPDEFFAASVAKTIGGLLFVFDPDKTLTDQISAMAKEEGLENVAALHRDFVARGTGLPKKSAEYLLFFNTINNYNREKLLREAYRILKPEGKIGVIYERSVKGMSFDNEGFESVLLDYDPEKFVIYKKAFNADNSHFGIILQKKLSQ